MGKRTSLDGSHAHRLGTGNALDKNIRHFSRLVRTETNANRSHYALGVLDVLMQIKQLRDDLRSEMKHLWRDRAIASAAYYTTKGFVDDLNTIPENLGGN